jgi:hypothetical protein
MSVARNGSFDPFAFPKANEPIFGALPSSIASSLPG